MKRFHVHVGVANLNDSVQFYSQLFGAQPSVLKTDYAKWMVDEPRVNFAISTNESHHGVSHLGLQADSAEELADIQRHFVAADPQAEDEPNAACCYARSDKHWATDPQGVRWEGFHSRGLLEDEARDVQEAPVAGARASASCCAPSAAVSVKSTARCCG